MMRGYTEYGEIMRFRDAQREQKKKARKARLATEPSDWGDPESQAYQFHFNDIVRDAGKSEGAVVHPEKREKKPRRRKA